MYYVYVLESQVDKTLYIGYTRSIEKRVYDHNYGNTRYTKRKRPWILLYKERYTSKPEAIKRELYLKKTKSSRYIRYLTEQNSDKIVETELGL
ncbi:hypothetical protein COU88_02595 [Candidatus Roizmanbacteria bacterium CG10_big_fil_rev_8_21_14_0_10_39_6]|uniref:GIY-YIG domain-containing protein n=1 Tax=Candidatus Roizmanbacteria bacterium CG10_big_fil_rev_8_21_14_0_10_39_6 TaxID=1974853 RepID=A0A2M8KSI3_9BACT|nr:MAG: hypothetical protein COU88_02595 [Candidatus Roizmanbacteria bacterium CG10_big_fil_rev_8_21_14_0_10_39_6]